MICRTFVCGMGAFLIGYGVYDYARHGHYPGPLIYTISFGLLLMVLGIFTSPRLCLKIADWIINAF